MPGVVTGCASRSVPPQRYDVSNLDVRHGSVRRDAKANVQLATAIAINSAIAPQDVRISKLKINRTNVRWIADTPSGRFLCSAFAPVRQAYCVKRGA